MEHLFVHGNQEQNAEVSENGVNWRMVPDDELQRLLLTPKQMPDFAIIYSRENPTEPATNQAMKTFKIIESAKLPIKLVKKKGSDGSGETEPNNEPSYANCLLVTLAKSPRSIAVLKSGQGVPDIETLSTDPNELTWIRGLPFDYSHLKSDIVIDTILKISKKKGLFSNDRELSTRMVLSDGKSEIVRFQIKPSKLSNGLQQLEISRQP